MVYENVPEHQGFDDGTAPEKTPRPISTDGWLERISDQLQVFVDAINAAREDDEDVSHDGAGDPGTETKTGDPAPPAEPDKKTTPVKKTTEVKGD